MQKNYKKKRERKNKQEIINKKENNIKTLIITSSGVIAFILLFYLANLGLTKLGAFEEGYTKPVAEEKEISYEEILAGNVFNRPYNTYYCLFDTYGDLTNNVYIEYLLSSKEYKNKIYKVDLSSPMNKTIVSEEINKKATKPSELKINNITLIKIEKGKISTYLVGDTKITTYLENLSK